MSGGTTEEDLRRTLRHFKRYMLSKMAAARDPITETFGSLGCGLIPIKPGAGSRPASLLEQSLLPKLSRPDDEASLSLESSGAAQMTIFYRGSVHVYDNVSVDQFQAIKRVAGEISTMDMPKITDQTSKANLLFDISKLPTAPDLRLARRHSIQQFLEKRRRRLAMQVPYAKAVLKDKHEKKHRESSDDGKEADEHHHMSFSPAPFPSKHGFSFPKGN